MPDSIPMHRLALSGIVAAVLLNLLLRTFVRLGGVLTTLLVAAAIAAVMAAWFAWRYRRAPTTGERWRLLGVYGGGLALLYIGLLTMMALQDNPSPMGLLIFALHYFSYPFFAWLFFSRRFHKGSR